MKRIPLALSLSFVCWPNSPVVSLFTDYKVPKGLRLWMSDLNDDFPSACRRQQQQSVVSLQLLYKHVSGVKKRLRELCLTFQTSIHRPDANCGLDGASMRHRCATRVYTSIMQYKKWAGQQSSQEIRFLSCMCAYRKTPCSVCIWEREFLPQACLSSLGCPTAVCRLWIHRLKWSSPEGDVRTPDLFSKHFGECLRLHSQTSQKHSVWVAKYN